MPKFKSSGQLVFVECNTRKSQNGNEFSIAKFADPVSFENLELFVGNDLDPYTLTNIPRGTVVNLEISANQYRGNTNFNVSSVVPVKS